MNKTACESAVFETDCHDVCIVPCYLPNIQLPSTNPPKQCTSYVGACAATMHEIHPWRWIRKLFHLARGWGHFLKPPDSILRVWHFLISWGSDAGPREPDAGLSSGALRAPELKTSSGMPARFARRLRRKNFLMFVSFFLCLGSQILVIFLQILVILGSEISYSAFSYRCLLYTSPSPRD